MSDGINSWIINKREPLLMSYDTLAECKKLGIRHGGRPAKSWLGAPMIYKDKVAGVLSVQSYAKTGLYDALSIELFDNRSLPMRRSRGECKAFRGGDLS